MEDGTEIIYKDTGPPLEIDTVTTYNANGTIKERNTYTLQGGYTKITCFKGDYEYKYKVIK